MTPDEEAAERRAALRQQIGELEREAQLLFHRSSTLIRQVSEDMIQFSTPEACTRIQLARACTANAQYARSLAQTLRTGLSRQ